MKSIELQYSVHPSLIFRIGRVVDILEKMEMKDIKVEQHDDFSQTVYFTIKGKENVSNQYMLVLGSCIGTVMNMEHYKFNNLKNKEL